MCGIAGFINRQLNQIQIVREMTACMQNRGPDGNGEWADEKTGVTFGHRRLSVIDLSESGAQPMLSADGRYVMTYNGEIYNAQELRKRVIQKRDALGERARFRGTSDTEILLESAALFGLEETLTQAKGMFALALYDRKEGVLMLARDRAGEKPLYYGFVSGCFVFASDPEAFRKYPGFGQEIDRDALDAYFQYGFIPAPYCIYKGIGKLLPGHILTLRAPFGRQQMTLHAYWTMLESVQKGQKEPFAGSLKEAADELERRLKDAIRGQMISDVPIGAFLSGGTDSPLIVSLMQKQSSMPVKTFTIGFEDPKYDEAIYAKEISAHLGTDHTQLYVTQQDLLDVIPGLSEIFTEPFADASQIPTCLVSRLAKTKVTVSLSGDAGDELFCGYRTYPKIAALSKRLGRIPKPLRALAGTALGMPFMREKRSCYRVRESLKAKDILQLHEAVCYHADYGAEQLVLREKRGNTEYRKDGMDFKARQALALPKASAFTDARDAMMYKDMVTYHPDDILVKVDRCGMAVSLENRVPMLDRDVMEFAFRLPLSYKYTEDGTGKRILKEILYRYVPKEMLERPKRGFSVPLANWLSEGRTGEWAKELLYHSYLVEDGILDRKMVSKVRERFYRRKDHAQTVWEILMAEQWYQRVSGRK